VIVSTVITTVSGMWMARRTPNLIMRQLYRISTRLLFALCCGRAGSYAVVAGICAGGSGRQII